MLLVLQFQVAVPTKNVLTFTSSLCRCVWLENQEATRCLMNPRQNTEELVIFRAVRLPLGSQFKGQTSQMTETVVMGLQKMTGPPGPAGKPGSSPETGSRWFETALLSPETLLPALSYRLLMSFWEWLWMTAGSPPTGTKEVRATKHPR